MQMSRAGFGERNFGQADLGDARRTRRLVDLADQMVSRPGGSLPEKLNAPRFLKAAYRFFDCEAVTHAAILQPHRQHLFRDVLPARDGFTLVIHDATELDYTKRRSLKDLGLIGNGYRRGLMAHNSLLVCPESRATLGLANQILHRRQPRPENETKQQRRQRMNRESRLWVRGVAPLPRDRKLVDVCDRGADTLEFLTVEVRSDRTFVIRASQNRKCYAGVAEAVDRPTWKLHDYARSLAELGRWELTISHKTEQKSPGRQGKKVAVTRRKRTATIAVSAGWVQFPLCKKKRPATLGMWVVRAWEVSPPAGEEPLEWILLTNHDSSQFAEASRVTGWYQCRWVIEEYHKGLKTGMNIEGFQFTSSSRLEPAIALTSITAITLLNLRDDSRNKATQNNPATDYLDDEYVEVLSMWRHGQPRLDWTVREFVLALARIAGHQNRKSDHPPGWQKLWQGWTELQSMLAGARIARNLKNFS